MTAEIMQAPVLVDINGRGKERPWSVHKTANEYIAAAYDDINPDKAERLRGCATRLTFARDPDGDKLHLDGAWFCRVRLCPMCQWRRALKVGAQMRDILAAIAKSSEPLSYIMLTLTLRNCEADKLSENIDTLVAGVNRLSKQVPYLRAVKGWYRGLEVTHKTDPTDVNYDTYHPHLHMILGVVPSYFKSRAYLSQARWTEMWQQAVRTDYAPRVDVRKVRGNTAAAIAEAAKYTVKPGDVVVPEDWDLTLRTVATLDPALHRRRLVAYGGRLKEVHRQLQLDDPDDGDLIHTDSTQTPADWERISYAWYTGYRQYRCDKE
jgi:plasmid rolling circle replication initiator protein Rep